MLNEIMLNLYAQEGISRQKAEEYFENLNEYEKKEFTDDLLFLALGSNVNERQLDTALENSGYRNTINYYNMLKSRRGVFRNNLSRLKYLEGKSFKQGFMLLLELFKEAYKYKNHQCQQNEGKCNHWWHRDLSDENILNLILTGNFGKSAGETGRIIRIIKEISGK
ncbi:DUF5958 family protein [Sebaldella sp. S0638]|uniref:DUF5958 family protein n=1 Tax=Sebaldella sp. S0638 TaxID=2957809 RepID=UPI00209EA691|nr:DUF5958 family protein [Sebaldella sp. S0638]MCP1225037.1 DUF5958 family protein [Sebaldella sp. S0638]